MALIVRGATEYSLCNAIIGGDDEIVATSHVTGDQSDSLWSFSDSAMHKHCFLAWDLRASFVERYNKTVGSITWGNGAFHELQPDGEILSRRRVAK